MGRLARFIRFYTEEDDDNGGGGALVTLTGAIVSFIAKAVKPIKELIVSLEPQQDLTYGDPYPAGTSKNLIVDGTDTNNGFVDGQYPKSDGTLQTDSNWYTSEYFSVTAGETYTWSTNGNPNSPSICFYDSSKNFISAIQAAQALPKTFTAPTGAVYCRASQGKNFLVNGQQIELGSTATTPKPYSNICPIGGLTSANVYVRSINFYDGVWENGNINDNTGQNSGSSSSYFRSKNYLAVPPNTNFYWYSPNRSGNFRQYFYDKDFNYLGHGERGWNRVISITDQGWAKDVAYIRFRVSSSYSEANDSKISINYPTDAHEYIPYDGATVPISWQTEAGTVYGGTLDVTTGELVVDRFAKVLNGTESWESFTGSGSKYFYAPIGSWSGTHVVIDYAICSHWEQKVIGTANSYIGCNIAHSSRNNKDSVFIRPEGYASTSTDQLKQYLADQYANETPVTVVYKLKPEYATTYQLTPEQVSTLKGENNIWASAGDVTVTAQGITPIE